MIEKFRLPTGANLRFFGRHAPGGGARTARMVGQDWWKWPLLTTFRSFSFGPGMLKSGGSPPGCLPS